VTVGVKMCFYDFSSLNVMIITFMDFGFKVFILQTVISVWSIFFIYDIYTIIHVYKYNFQLFLYQFFFLDLLSSFSFLIIFLFFFPKCIYIYIYIYIMYLIKESRTLY